MKDERRRTSILHGAILLLTLAGLTGFARADSRIAGSHKTSFDRHTVQDGVSRTPHTVQDEFKERDDELPEGEEEWRRRKGPPIEYGRQQPPADSAAAAPRLTLSAWGTPIEADAGAGPAFDPAALPTALPEFLVRAPIDDTGRGLVPIAAVPGPGALPLLGLGALALVGRRRRR